MRNTIQQPIGIAPRRIRWNLNVIMKRHLCLINFKAQKLPLASIQSVGHHLLTNRAVVFVLRKQASEERKIDKTNESIKTTGEPIGIYIYRQ